MSPAPKSMQSCRVQSEGVKNESKGLQETGFLANGRVLYVVASKPQPVGLIQPPWAKNWCVTDGVESVGRRANSPWPVDIESIRRTLRVDLP